MPTAATLRETLDLAVPVDVAVPDLECCPPGRVQAMPVDRAEELAGLLKAVADPTRLRLLSLVAGSVDGEACICDLTSPVGLSQPTVSHHMKILVEAGLLQRDQRGRWAYYRLVPGALEQLARNVVQPVAGPH